MRNLPEIFCLLAAIGMSEAARILAVYPIPSISHQVVFRSLMHELVRRGHEVVVITTDPAFPKGSSPKNLTEIDVHDLSYKLWHKLIKNAKPYARYSTEIMKLLLKTIIEIFETQIQFHDVQKLIIDKNRSFDLLLVEACVRPALGFAYLYNVPVIEFSSLGALWGTLDHTGAAINPLVYPLWMQKKICNLTLWEKISALYNDYAMNAVFKEHQVMENNLVRRQFGQNIPDLSQLKKNVQLIFLNVNPIWDFNRPVPPNVVYLGGIHQKPTKELPKDIKSYLDSSINGVIYVSFGTNTRPSTLPPEKLRIFKNVFSKVPYDILWKYDEDELPGFSENVKLSKWLPQSDLLRHPNVKLFITQGGLQSTDEALDAGVPLVVIPFHADQWFNAQQCVKHNIGIFLDIEIITETEFKAAIETAIRDKTYRENVVQLHRLMRDQPQSPLERAVWWTEHVLRHGGAAHLRAAAAHMHWTEYYALDVVLLLLSVSLLLLIGLGLAIRFIMLKMQRSGFKIHFKKN